MYSLGFRYNETKIQAIWSENGTALLNLAKKFKTVNFNCWVSGNGLISNSSSTSDGIVFNDKPFDVIKIGKLDAPMFFNEIYFSKKSISYRWRSENQKILTFGENFETSNWPRNFIISFNDNITIKEITKETDKTIISVVDPVSAPITNSAVAPAAAPIAEGKTVGETIDAIMSAMKAKLAVAEENAAKANVKAQEAETKAAKLQKELDETKNLVEMLRTELKQFYEDEVNEEGEKETSEEKVEKPSFVDQFRNKYYKDGVDILGRSTKVLNVVPKASDFKIEVRMDAGENGYTTYTPDSKYDLTNEKQRDIAFKEVLSQVLVRLPEDDDAIGWRNICRWIESGKAYEQDKWSFGDILNTEEFCYQKSEAARKMAGLPSLSELHRFQDLGGMNPTENDDRDFEGLSDEDWPF